MLSPAARPDAPVARLREAVDRILATNPGIGNYESGCIDVSAALRAALQREGIETELVMIEPSLGSLQTMTLRGERAEGKIHGFLVFRQRGEEVIIDPTVQQFFKGPAGSVPRAFVGTRDDAATLFTREQERLQVEIDADPQTGQYDPLAFTELVYGLGAYRSLRFYAGS
ncbi:MAG: hypothetical protein VKQ33_08245 [Candidatus Sericytochromatia bacterium]|nr:hypothetical protein [Candidatus Sericytochromatia bacterium]